MVKPVPPPSIANTWPPPNYVNPQKRGPALLVISLIFILLTIGIVGLRTYVRVIVLRAPGWDDYFIWIATFGAIALVVAVNVSTAIGWDRHMWDQQPIWFESSEVIQWIIQLLFLVIMSTTKISALCTYLRISTGTRYRRFVWVTLVFIAVWAIAFFFATVFGCWPVHLYWSSRDGKGCTDEGIRLLSATVINIITDFVVVLMPVPIIFKLKIPLREKIILAVLMSLGLFASLASIIRTILMSKELETYDVTWIGWSIFIWTSIECDLAIICISIPVLRTVAKRLFPTWSTAFRSTTSGRRETAASSGEHFGLEPRFNAV